MAPLVLNMQSKHCKYCNTTKPVTEFHKSKVEKYGVRGKCKQCTKDYNASRYQNTREERLQWQYDYYQENSEAVKEYNREHYKRYYPLNKPKYYSKNAKRRAIAKQATPEWANLQYIEDLYANAAEANELFKDIGIKFHVDHIVPLNSPVVCGLHVEDNLQILTAEENLAKSNKFDI